MQLLHSATALLVALATRVLRVDGVGIPKPALYVILKLFSNLVQALLFLFLFLFLFFFRLLLLLTSAAAVNGTVAAADAAATARMKHGKPKCQQDSDWLWCAIPHRRLFLSFSCEGPPASPCPHARGCSHAEHRGLPAAPFRLEPWLPTPRLGEAGQQLDVIVTAQAVCCLFVSIGFDVRPSYAFPRMRAMLPFRTPHVC